MSDCFHLPFARSSMWPCVVSSLFLLLVSIFHAMVTPLCTHSVLTGLFPSGKLPCCFEHSNAQAFLKDTQRGSPFLQSGKCVIGRRNLCEENLIQFIDNKSHYSPNYPVNKYAVWASLELMIFCLPESLKFWDFSCVPPPQPASTFYLNKTNLQSNRNSWEGRLAINAKCKKLNTIIHLL